MTNKRRKKYHFFFALAISIRCVYVCECCVLVRFFIHFWFVFYFVWSHCYGDETKWCLKWFSSSLLLKPIHNGLCSVYITKTLCTIKTASTIWQPTNDKREKRDKYNNFIPYFSCFIFDSNSLIPILKPRIEQSRKRKSDKKDGLNCDVRHTEAFIWHKRPLHNTYFFLFVCRLSFAFLSWIFDFS